MAAAHLTLEEAADRLNLTPEEFKRRLKTDKVFKELDAAKIRDGSTFRFKSAAVEELARQLGVDSSPELPLSPLGEGPPPDSDDFKVPTLARDEPRKTPDKKGGDEPLLFSADDDDIFSLAADEPKADPKKPGKSTDSDARLEGDKPRKGKDKKGEKDEAVVPTEEIAIDFGGPGSAVIKGGSSAKLSAPKSSSKLGASDSGKGLANPGVGDSSEFELSLDADSDDFELKLNADASDDEVELGGLPRDPSGSSSGKRGAESGILNRTPADSGISLEKGKGGGKSDRIKGDKEKPKSDRIRGEKPKPASAEDSDSDVDFELTLDSSAAASASRLGGPKGAAADDADSSDSEFELTLDDGGASSLEHAALGDGGDEDSDLVVDEPESDKGDIFETDFEIPPMDESGSEAVALETSDTDLEKSDFDIADSDVAEDTSGSEVVLLEDDEEAPAPKARGKSGKKPAPAEEDEGGVDLADVEPVEEDDSSAAAALRGAKGGADDEEEEEEAATAGAGADYRPAPWGIIPALLLLPTAAVTLVGAVMAFQLLQTMSGYQQPRKPAAPLIRDLAKSLEMPLNDQ